jgi:hypothetical protein
VDIRETFIIAEVANTRPQMCPFVYFFIDDNERKVSQTLDAFLSFTSIEKCFIVVDNDINHHIVVTCNPLNPSGYFMLHQVHEEEFLSVHSVYPCV